MPYKLALLTRQPAHYHDLLLDKLPSAITLLGQPDRPIEPTELADADLVLAEPKLLADHLARLPKLRWAQSTFAGVDALIDDRLRQDYLLTNVRGIFGQPMSEYVLGYLLGYYRQHTAYRQQQAQSQWQRLPPQTLAGKTLLVLGCGDIGGQVAAAARAFGMRTLGVSRLGQAVAGFERVWPVDELCDALPQADAVVSVLPATPHTAGLLGQQALCCCKPGAVLVNVGRGSVLDETALLHALDSGPLAHAILDVFSHEPLPGHSPLWSHPAITLTPHVSATSVPEQVVEIFLDNAQRFVAEQPLKHRVEFSRGY